MTPTAFHCTIVSDTELARPRRIGRMVRLGRVRRIGTDRIVRRHGVIPTT